MLIFRKISCDDLEMIMNWRMLPEVTKYMYTDPVISLPDQRKWYERVKSDDSCKYWIIQMDGVDVGLVSLTNIDRENKKCSWAYYIANTTMRGKGLGREIECNIYDIVFEKLGLEKLCCEVFANNEKVVQIHEHFGARREGFYRQHIIKNGQKCDVVAMAILKDEWEILKKGISYNEAKFEL